VVTGRESGADDAHRRTVLYLGKLRRFTHLGPVRMRIASSGRMTGYPSTAYPSVTTCALPNAPTELKSAGYRDSFGSSNPHFWAAEFAPGSIPQPILVIEQLSE
jgi:hypothetical protein